ncbi:MAG: asparagine synthase (glutamine-hydrolyzing) [Cyanobacteria bacterium P01_A01_bin.68]
MCGITGFWDISRQISNDKLPQIVRQMSNTLTHRGPDDSGTWIDGEAGVALGHRRLAIIDLSPGGHQPMLSGDNRYAIVFNGEIYNFLELRRELEQLGHKFRGHSDTEIMLAGFSQWGVHSAVERFNGMFAFALWDRRERVIHLGRDRMGEKPLYYGFTGRTLLFASELKALKAYPDFHPEINRDALASFLRYSYISSPKCIYKGIYKLPPGCILSWDGNDIHPEPKPYWQVKQAALTGVGKPFKGSELEAVEQLEALLKDAVGLRMIADVPLGAFLSGGIDSSTIVALMQAQNSRQVKTFTIGFHEREYNEAQHAKAIAEHLGTNHTELYVTPEDTLSVIPKLPSLYDEPFSDQSQIPTYLVSQLAKESVTVSLSGDGGDELFAGYNRHFLGRSIWQKIGWIPSIFRHVAAGGITAITPGTWDHIFDKVNPVLPKNLRYSSWGDYLHKLAKVLPATNPQSMYGGLVSHWSQNVVIGASEHLNPGELEIELSDFTQQMVYMDTVTYLPDDILVKLDRASMGVGLEGRIPMLDHRLVEFAWGLPLSMKIRDGMGKWLLRQVLYKYVPKELIERPKMGFGVPIDSWLRGPLREWAAELLDETRLHQQGFLNPQPILKLWEEHLSGNRNWQYHLWDVLMFQAWLEKHY